jgi:branched-chain amino acid transport system substrate-binding protein
VLSLLYHMRLPKTLLLVGAAILLSSCGTTSEPQTGRSIRIGALLDLSGSWKSLGASSQSVMQIAADDANKYLDSVGSDLRVSIEVVDTKLDPATALNKMKDLSDDGVTIFVGPQSSSEIREVKQTADDRGLLVISQGSTAGSLAIENDNIFRFCPDDHQEGVAMAELLWEDSVQAIVPLYRDDAGNTGLRNATSSSFTSRGRVAFPGILYPAAGADLVQTVSDLSSAVKQATDQYGSNSVAVYAACFEEVRDILKLAKNDAVLSSVKWYGSDGVAHSSVVIADAEAASFAETSGYPNPTFGVDDSSKSIWELVAARAGITPEAFAFAAYDAVRVAALAALEADNSADIATMKAAFVAQANKYSGATGKTSLNAAGDRSTGSFDFWAIRKNSAGFEWKIVAKFTPDGAGSGKIVRF